MPETTTEPPVREDFYLFLFNTRDGRSKAFEKVENATRQEAAQAARASGAQFLNKANFQELFGADADPDKEVAEESA